MSIARKQGNSRKAYGLHDGALGRVKLTGGLAAIGRDTRQSDRHSSLESTTRTYLGSPVEDMVRLRMGWRIGFVGVMKREVGVY